VRLAIISDIHANREALTAILADIETQGNIEQIISAGNSVGLGPHPNEVLDLLREKNVESVMGNYEDAIVFDRMSSGVDFADEAAERVDRAAVRWTRRELNPENFKQLENLPQNLRLIGTARHMELKRDQPDERISEARRGMFFGTLFQSRARQSRSATQRILILHGSPRALNEAIQEDTANSILERLAQMARADVVISAHGGRPFLRELAKVAFVGTGVASGSRALPEVAEYSIVTVEDGVSLESRTVTYDRGPHVQAILDYGLPPALAARFDPTGL
jgi:predicted phosphodiesterase